MNAKLLALFAVAVLLSGCALFAPKPKPATPQEQAIALSEEQTTEGETLSALANAFEKTEECTDDEYLRVANLAQQFAKGVKIETDPAKARQIVAASKACDPHIDTKATKKSEGVYLVEYTATLEKSCPYAHLFEVQSNRVVIEANTQTNTSKVVEGDFDEETRAKLEAMLPGLPLMGNCVAALTIGSSGEVQ